MLFTDQGNGCYEHLRTDISQGNCDEPAVAPANPFYALNVLDISAKMCRSGYGNHAIVFSEKIQNIGNVSALDLRTTFSPHSKATNDVESTIRKIPAGSIYDTNLTRPRNYHGYLPMDGSHAGFIYKYEYSVYAPTGEAVATDALSFVVPDVGPRDLSITSHTPIYAYVKDSNWLTVETGSIGVTNFANEFVYGVSLEYYFPQLDKYRCGFGPTAFEANEQRMIEVGSCGEISGPDFGLPIGTQLTVEARLVDLANGSAVIDSVDVTAPELK